MLKIQSIIRGLLALSVVLGLTIAGPAVAASACKGAQKSACSKNDACSWVESYKTKTGTSVKGHCRAKPGKGAAKKAGAAADKAKKTTSKAADKASKAKDSAKSKAKKTKDAAKSKSNKATSDAKKKAKKATDKAKKKAADKAKKSTK